MERDVFSNRDVQLLFLTRVARLASFGGVTVVLLLYLASLGITDAAVGVLLTTILIGDFIVTLFITTHADSFGRRRMLVIGAALKLLAGFAFGWDGVSFAALVAAGVAGVISPHGGDTGPFLSLEQAALSDLITDTVAAAARAGSTTASASTAVSDAIATTFGYYNAVGSGALALGALITGWGLSFLIASGWQPVDAYRTVFWAYSIIAGIMILVYGSLSSAVEARPRPTPRTQTDKPVTGWMGLQSKDTIRIVFGLACLFALDAFAGGLVMQSWLVNYFHIRWEADIGVLGSMLMAANAFGGISGIFAAKLVKRWGAVATMVYTHLPSNVLLMLIPLMPTLPSAIGMLLLRFSISQMDVPARQAFLAMSVSSTERSAANGICSIVRSLGVTAVPLLLGGLTHTRMIDVPFFAAGVLKIVYDLLVWGLFSRTEAQQRATAAAAAAAAAAPSSAQTASNTSTASINASRTAKAVIDEDDGDDEEEAAALLDSKPAPVNNALVAAKR